MCWDHPLAIEKSLELVAGRETTKLPTVLSSVDAGCDKDAGHSRRLSPSHVVMKRVAHMRYAGRVIDAPQLVDAGVEVIYLRLADVAKSILRE